MVVSCWPAICNASGPQSVQVPVALASDIRVSHASWGSGPRPSNVYSTVQDDQGFLWFGTTYGLLRYDGYEFDAFRPESANPNSISGASINALMKDRSGMLWVGADEFLDRYDPRSEHFQHYRLAASHPCAPIGTVRRIIQDRRGMMWLATDTGLKRLDPGASRVTCYRHRDDDQSSIASDLVRAIVESKDGTLWIATSEGLDRFDTDAEKVTRHVQLVGPSGDQLALRLPQVFLLEDHLGVLWIAAHFGDAALSFDPRTDTVTVYRFDARRAGENVPAGAFGLLEDESGALWFGFYGRGLVKFDRDRKAAVRYQNDPNDPGSLKKDLVTSVFMDREQRIWVGTWGGAIDQVDPNPSSFRTYRHESGKKNSLSNDSVTAVYEDSRRVLWVGTQDGLNAIDRESGKVTRYRIAGVGRAGAGVVLSIAEDRAGHLWLGTLSNGLYRFDRDTGAFKSYLHDPADPKSLSNNYITALLVDHRDTLWVGTVGALARFDPATERFQAYRAVGDGLSHYRGIAEDPRGALWLASWGDGLQRFDPMTGEFAIYRNKPGDPRTLSSNRVSAVCIDRFGTVWAGTYNGLNRLDQVNHTLSKYDEHDGLPSDMIVAIARDRTSDLWLSTNNGLSRFNPRTKTFSNFYVADGLPGNGFSNSAATASASSRGEMFFGLDSGLTAFFPDRMTDVPGAPPIVLTKFQMFGGPVSVGENGPLKQAIAFTQSLTLEHWENMVSLEFSALSYTDPSRNRYRHRLEGLEKEWRETDSTRRLVMYTSLPPGDYIFRVQGSNSHGVWNSQGASLHIRVLAPWWSTWWCRVALAASLLVLLWTFYQLRLRQLAQQFNLGLEARVSERTRIARELHDTLLQSVQGVLVHFQAATNLLPERPDEAKRRFESVIDRAARAVTEGRDAVWDLRSSTVATNDLALAISVLGDELTAVDTDTHSAVVRVNVEGTPRNLQPIVRDDVYRIAAEAVRNAIRHAHAQLIQVDVRYGERQLQLRIRDNGRGIDPRMLDERVLAGHWGLPGMRERAELIGGHLEVRSQIGSGTEIDLRLPAVMAYAASPDRRRFWWFTAKTGANS